MYFFAFLIFVVFPLSFFVFHFFTRKYLNPYKLIFIFGKKGSGKSTLLAKYAYEYRSRGWSVYCTEAIPGTRKIDYTDIGYKQFPERSCIIVDEVGMIWDNRNFKSFKPEVRDFFKLQRHYKCCLILASQTFDVDKKIRDLADEMYLVKKSFRVFSYAKRILRQTVLVKSTAEAPAKIDEDLVFDSLLLFWAGSRKLSFIPKWSAWFDSFAAPQLAASPDQEIPLRDDLIKKRYVQRRFYRSKKKRISFRLRLLLIVTSVLDKLKRPRT